MRNIDFAKKCIRAKNMRAAGYRDAIINMRLEKFSLEDMKFFTSIYFTIKGNADFTADRGIILVALVLQCLQYDLKDFFLSVYKKESDLDMKLAAIRGYSAYASEKEIIPLMKKFIEILIKRAEHTPYNYQEYEMLRSKFGLPYLIEHYGYDCFTEAMTQLNKQYDDMPDVCKGFFTFDDNGIQINLLSSSEIGERLNALFENAIPRKY